MLIATLFSALALTQTVSDPWACDLAPSIGQGSSDEGDVDTFSSVSFACRYRLFTAYGIGVSPSLGIDKQMWSVYENDSDHKNISSYETEDFHAGFFLDHELTSQSKIFYGFAFGRGQGKLERTESTENTSVNGSYNGLTQTYLSHTLGASYGLTEKLNLTVAWQRQDAKQKWKVKTSDIFVQTVDENQALSLADGSSTQLLGSSVRTQNQRTTNAVQIGLSLSFGG